MKKEQSIIPTTESPSISDDESVITQLKGEYWLITYIYKLRDCAYDDFERYGEVLTAMNPLQWLMYARDKIRGDEPIYDKLGMQIHPVIHIINSEKYGLSIKDAIYYERKINNYNFPLNEDTVDSKETTPEDI